jgi:hypothetical protein
LNGYVSEQPLHCILLHNRVLLTSWLMLQTRDITNGSVSKWVHVLLCEAMVDPPAAALFCICSVSTPLPESRPAVAPKQLAAPHSKSSWGRSNLGKSHSICLRALCWYGRWRTTV